MKFGLFAMNMGVCSHPEVMTRVAQAAMQAIWSEGQPGAHSIDPFGFVVYTKAHRVLVGPGCCFWSVLGYCTSYHGRFVSFANVQAYPLPLQRPHPPIVVGGRSPAAYRRAVEKANGWYGYNFDLDRTAEAITRLRRAGERYERPAELGTLEISVMPARRVDHAMVEQYAALGVHRLILRPPHTLDGPGLEQFVMSVGTSLIEPRT